MPESKCCSSPMDYKIESIVTVDERGQMVLPKNIRQKLGINAGDRLAVAIGVREGKVCCLQLILMPELDRKAGEIVSEGSK
ncbi:MAG: SpoVT / AbrB like domain protein [Methanomassiliicoccales archaeon PtaU1.Bin124]|nr:MAG: SpoVT / AbrB like domain protein [Methanomassiliicoccales archaeon PtaU1.Bin124]